MRARQGAKSHHFGIKTTVQNGFADDYWTCVCSHSSKSPHRHVRSVLPRPFISLAKLQNPIRILKTLNTRRTKQKKKKKRISAIERSGTLLSQFHQFLWIGYWISSSFGSSTLSEGEFFLFLRLWRWRTPRVAVAERWIRLRRTRGSRDASSRSTTRCFDGSRSPRVKRPIVPGSMTSSGRISIGFLQGRKNPNPLSLSLSISFYLCVFVQDWEFD